jgi:hypothetical protein
MLIRTARWATVAALTVGLTGCTSSTGTPSPPADTPTPTVGAPTSTPKVTAPPPVSTSWTVPADASAAARAAGLPMLGEEKLAVHYHAHLDVIVNGTAVPVPAGLGIDQVRQLIAPLHTHDGTGVVHIESATDTPFTLGQVFTEWGQALRADQVGPVALPAGTVLRVYRNGHAVPGDPASLRLGAHDEIVVWVGPGGQSPQVPASYPFPPGE